MSWLSDDAVRRLRDAARWPEFDDTRYTVREEIGRGGMGAVFLATDESLGRDVAIKVSSAAGAGRELDARLRTEARILARLEHPGIVPVHDAGRLADGRLYVVMKRVEGETLDRHLAHVSALAERLRIFERICEPVAFAHAHGFVHRDLKPANVMVGRFGEVLVMDWGVAKVLGTAQGAADGAGQAPPADRGPAPEPSGMGALACAAGDPAAEASTQADTIAGTGAGTGAGTVLGTRGFMAPEQAAGGATAVDQRADVYGLGAILVTLLASGVAPDEHEISAEERLERLRHLSRRMRAICAKALAADPAGRYPSVEALAADIDRFRAGEPVEAYRENLVERGWRVLYRYRTPALLVLAYLLMRVIVALTVRR